MMDHSQYDSVISGMHKLMEIQKATKADKPKGALDRDTFNLLPIGTDIWLVKALSNQSWITHAVTRKEHSYDHKSDHLSDAFILNLNEVFLISKLGGTYEKENYNIYAKEYYDSYNMGPGAYNDSYVFLNKEDAENHLNYCKNLPSYKSEEERKLHEDTIRELNEIGDRMMDDFIDDPRWDSENPCLSLSYKNME